MQLSVKKNLDLSITGFEILKIFIAKTFLYLNVCCYLLTQQFDFNNHQYVGISDEKKRSDLLTELNVAKAVYNICHTRIVQNAWEEGQELNVHGWCYRYHYFLISTVILLYCPYSFKNN